MKKIMALIITVAMVLPAIAQDKTSIGKVTFPIGKNYIQAKGTTNWGKIKYYMPVYDMDKVKTEKDSRCEITFVNKKVMRIGENSIAEVTHDDAGVEEVKISKGWAWLSIFLPKGTSKLRVRTPSSVCAIRGTVYRLNCDDVQTTYRCYQGDIKVTPFKKDGKTLADSSFNIGVGEELIVISDFEKYKEQQEKEYQEWDEDEGDAGFEKFMQQEQEDLDEMIESDLKDFKEMQGISYKRSTFDKTEDDGLDWVQWNKERDKLISE